MKKQTQIRKAGFTLVEIMIVVMILGVLLSIAITNYVRQRASAQANTCISNLLKIESAAAQFAVENRKRTGDPINFPDDLKPYIKLNTNGQIPSCPASGTYSIAAVGSNPVCSLGTTVNPPHLMP